MSEPTDELTPAIYAIQRACDEVLNVDDPDKVADILERIQKHLSTARDFIEPAPPVVLNVMNVHVFGPDDSLVGAAELTLPEGAVPEVFADAIIDHVCSRFEEHSDEEE